MQTEIQEHRKGVKLLLQGGMILSVLFMFSGLVLHAAFSTDSVSAGFKIQDIQDGTLEWSQLLIAAGIFVLALTPVFRVLMLMWLWFRAKDWNYVAISGTVLLILTLSVYLGQN